MSATHAWNNVYPTSDTSVNRRLLIAACEQAESQGAGTVIVIANAIGEAQEVYIALCRAQMAGQLARYRIFISGRGAEIAQRIAHANADPYSPWALPIVVSTAWADRSRPSITIVSEDRWNQMSSDEMAGVYMIRPVVEPGTNTGTHYSISLHASWFELYATALALRTHSVGLYHCGTNTRQSPLYVALASRGRSMTSLDTTPALL
jgi:hypothetical protein